MKASTRFIILFNVALLMLLIIGQKAACLSMCLESPVPLPAVPLNVTQLWPAVCCCWLPPPSYSPGMALNSTAQESWGGKLSVWVSAWMSLVVPLRDGVKSTLHRAGSAKTSRSCRQTAAPKIYEVKGNFTPVFLSFMDLG